MMRAYCCLGLLLLFNLSLGCANSLQPKITLLALKAHQTTEVAGDELFVTVTTYPAGSQKAMHHRIPKAPGYWLSKHLDKVNKILLWNKPLEDKQAATVIISFMEHDFPPLDTDDLIGSVRLKLRNKDGKLESQWSIPNRADAPVQVQTQHGLAQKIELLSPDSRYEAYFLVETAKKK